MAEEIKITEQKPTPAPQTTPAATTAPKATPASAPAAAPKTTTQAKVKLVLTGAGSFSGLGLHCIHKGQEVAADNATANKLVATGLFKKV